MWKEIEHELDDIRVGNDAGTLVALHGSRILKFFNIPSMRSQVKLLEYIVRTWNPEQQYFEVGAHVLKLEVEDIYFLIGPSWLGEPISLTVPLGGEITT